MRLNTLTNHFPEAFKRFPEEVKKAEQTPGVQMCWMTDDTVAKWEEVAYGLWDEMAAKDAACAKAIELIKEWRGVK